MGPIKKILGLVLLIAGLAVIFYGLCSSYNIFTVKAPAPEIFKTTQSSKTGSTNDVQAIVQEQLKGLLPTGSLPELLNLISWSIFAGILVLGGGQIASLGIKLIK